MWFLFEQGIVPQLLSQLARRCNALAGAVWALGRLVFAAVATLVLAACASSVQLRAQPPAPPATLEEAKAYVASRERVMEHLEYELNQQSIACYKRFFVASCLDDVRLQGAKLRRAHLEVQGQADDMIRLDEYAKRQARQRQ
ncbi:hypothetical protein [Limnobacter sp.]|uniref:hypothetical protein n=1 Tax=Limnobacter sp. TaxID=2003368 RepID=UPI003512894D